MGIIKRKNDNFLRHLYTRTIFRIEKKQGHLGQLWRIKNIIKKVISCVQIFVFTVVYSTLYSVQSDVIAHFILAMTSIYSTSICIVGHTFASSANS